MKYAKENPISVNAERYRDIATVFGSNSIVLMRPIFESQYRAIGHFRQFNLMFGYEPANGTVMIKWPMLYFIHKWYKPLSIKNTISPHEELALAEVMAHWSFQQIKEKTRMFVTLNKTLYKYKYI